MDSRCLSLKLFLEELGISDTIDSVDDRKQIQKAVYLGQRAGVKLGYRFGWYLLGPYSPQLTRDYYALAGALSDGDEDHVSRELIPSLRQKLAKIKPLMNSPEEELQQEDWLELVASADYLLTVRKLDSKRAQKVLEKEKPNLAPKFETALTARNKYLNG